MTAAVCLVATLLVVGGLVLRLDRRVAGQTPPPQSGEKIGAEVLNELRTRPEVPVVVALAEPPSVRQPIVAIPALKGDVQKVQDAVLSKVGGSDFRITYRYQAVPALAGSLTARGLQKLAADPNVVRIDVDVGGSGALSDTVPLINADDLHALGITGDSVVVAVLDTGVDTDHLDLSDHLIHQECFLDFDGAINGIGRCPNGSDRQSGAGAAESGLSHGAMTTGIITSKGTVSSVGVAPDARIVAIKILDDSPPGGRFMFYSEIVAALDFILSNRPDVRVINMSLGTDALFTGNCDTATSYNIAGAAAVNALRNRDPNPVITFASSGNNASGTQMGSPACLSNVVSVGATQKDDNVASFTNSNSTLDLMAPGVNITTTGLANGTATGSGTSFASPHAAGCAALLLEANQDLTPTEIETRLKDSPVHVTDPKNGRTFPRIDCYAAAFEATPEPPVGGIAYHDSPSESRAGGRGASVDGRPKSAEGDAVLAGVGVAAIAFIALAFWHTARPRPR